MSVPVTAYPPSPGDSPQYPQTKPFPAGPGPYLGTGPAPASVQRSAPYLPENPQSAPYGSSYPHVNQNSQYQQQYPAGPGVWPGRGPQQPNPVYGSPRQPVVVQHVTATPRRRCNHPLHFALTLVSCGLWAPVWLFLAIVQR
ncbi:hypothetical protein GCM10023319_23000 [Nocardia iowensis]